MSTIVGILTFVSRILQIFQSNCNFVLGWAAFDRGFVASGPNS